MDRGAVRLVRVVEDLLLLAKVGDPHLPLLTRSGGPAPTWSTTSWTSPRSPTSAGSRCRVEGDRTSQFVAAGDPAELDIMVTNLVSNAIKYSAADSTVTVTLSRDDDGSC